MKKFTREELTKAYAQIEEERREERTRAERAAIWLQKHCRLPVQAVQLPSYASTGIRADIPYLPEYLLSVLYTKYSTMNCWLQSRLVKPPELPGIHQEEGGFWLDLWPDDGFPRGTRYYCYTSLTDAGD